MKEIVVISGKGGTGKTSITASFSALENNNIVIADCDVDAADMHLLVKPNFAFKEKFYSGMEATIDQSKCNGCGKCFNHCHFKAITKSIEKNSRDKHSYIIEPLKCEGCGLCAKLCPTDAITLKERMTGHWYISNTKYNAPMVHASLEIGSENSGKMVAHVKKEARKIAENENKKYILIDGSPGTACPVISSLSGVHYVVIVTEATVSGIHDLKRVYELVKKFKLPAGVIINKYDLNQNITDDIVKFLKEENIFHINNIAYDTTFTKAMLLGKTIVDFDDGILSEIVKDSWLKIKNKLKEK